MSDETSIDAFSVKKNFRDAKVLFATNGDDGEDSPLRLSIRTYCDIVSDDNFVVLESKNGEWFGKNAFLKMFDYAMEHGFDYLIYIDADCFIVSHENLWKLFSDFRKSGCILGGPPDGGLFCHRNANRFAINPFLMFVDVKQIAPFKSSESGEWTFNDNRKNPPSYDSILKNIRIETLRRNTDVLAAYAHFMENTKKQHFSVPHADMISNPHNKYEIYYGKNQKPWTHTETVNVEPYYDIFLGVYDGKHGVFSMFGRDYPCEADQSGITSAVYCSPDIEDDGNLVCLHTWFTRFSNSKGVPFERMTRDRIFAVGNYAKSLVLNNK